MKLLLSLTIALFLFCMVRLLVATQPAVLSAAPVVGPAQLAIPTAIVALDGLSVTVPIAFQSGEHSVGSTTFSLDFDEGCLAFDPRDGNNDGRPDSVQFTSPPAFRSSASYNGADTDGEIDVVIADYSLPIASLPDNEALLSVAFTASCIPAAGVMITAPVRFSLAPKATFGDANGTDVEGEVFDGYVMIYDELPPTATPTPTPTLTPSATPGPGTPSATPTATATPSPTATSSPTATPTASTTPTPGTPTPGTPTSQSNPIYLPMIKRSG